MFRWRDVLVLSTALLVTACDDDKGEEETEAEEEVTVPAEYGPENSWPHALESEVPEGLEGTGYGEGDIAHNFTFKDQYGDEVELYQFYGQVILLDVFAEW